MHEWTQWNAHTHEKKEDGTNANFPLCCNCVERQLQKLLITLE